MEAKFVFVILCVELAALYFNIHHLQSKELDVYNSFDETPISYNYSNNNYTCFKTVNHCHYESHTLQPINVIHCVLICVAIVAYICVLVLLIRAHCFRRSTQPELRPAQKHSALNYRKNRLYKSAEILILFVTGANTILLGLQYNYETEMIKTCSRVSRFIRIENLTTYILINAMECSYIFFDLVFTHASDDHNDERSTLLHNEHRRSTADTPDT